VENFSVVQQACLLHGAARQKSGKIPVILLIHSQAPRRHGRAANVADATAGPRPRSAKQIIRPKMVKRPAETKDPSGGTTGRVKLYGRWGGWALAPNTASLGRDYRSHSDRSRRPRETFKAPADFFNFSSWVFFGGKVIPRRDDRRRLLQRPQARSARGSSREHPVDPAFFADPDFAASATSCRSLEFPKPPPRARPAW
jgi:hypothetical protein